MSGSTRGEWDGISVLALSPTLPSEIGHPPAHPPTAVLLKFHRDP
jgi:hypothetical protein